VIGSIRGDGSVYKDETRYQYVIELAVIDPEFAITFSRAMSRLLNKKYIEPRWAGEKEMEGEVSIESLFYVI